MSTTVNAVLAPEHPMFRYYNGGFKAISQIAYEAFVAAEEAQEAVEAMLNGDDENLCEELGDVLLQVVLNAQIGAEDGSFTIDDVIHGISEKMIRRHPWVFSDVEVDSIDENVSLWEKIKQKEKETK